MNRKSKEVIVQGVVRLKRGEACLSTTNSSSFRVTSRTHTYTIIYRLTIIPPSFTPNLGLRLSDDRAQFDW
jgi:hypothetical protein